MFPYVNGTQWGAETPAFFDNTKGSGTILLPLPTAGPAKVFVAWLPSYPSGFVVGTKPPAGAVMSNTVTITVAPRAATRPKQDPQHVTNKIRVFRLFLLELLTHTAIHQLVGMDWEPWFTTMNDQWGTAEAIPMLGRYSSFNLGVIRQHCRWFMNIGIDFVAIGTTECCGQTHVQHCDLRTRPFPADWTNNLWGKQHWSQRNPNVQQLANATTLMMETYHQLYTNEGWQVPKTLLLLGLDNGPKTTLAAIGEEMDWITENYVKK